MQIPLGIRKPFQLLFIKIINQNRKSGFTKLHYQQQNMKRKRLADILKSFKGTHARLKVYR